MIPNRIKLAIDRHAEHGYPCGSFVTAVLENDFMEAAVGADDECALLLPEIARYIYNNIPGGCCGSPEKVKSWQEQKQKQRESAGKEQRDLRRELHRF